MSEVVVQRGGVLELPGLTGYAMTVTMAWLLSFDSKNTRAAYRVDLRLWLDFCDEQDIDPLKASRQQGDVWKRWLEMRAIEARWQAHCKKRPEDADDADAYARWAAVEAEKALPANTLARRISSVSSWYSYLVTESAADSNPFALVRRPKIDGSMSETTGLSHAQARALLAAAEADKGRHRLRTIALLRLLLETGIRVTEAVAARLTDLGQSQGHRTLRVIAKGKKPITRKVSPGTAYAIDEYLADRAQRAGVAVDELDGPLFATDSGLPVDRGEVHELVVRLGEAAGIEGVHPHMLRHTFALLAEQGGKSVKQIQAALGHANSSTTDIYLQTADRLKDDPSSVVAALLE